MMKKWTALLLTELGLIFCLTPYINKYDALGSLSFALVIIIIPYTIYKALPYHRLSFLLAISTPIPLGLSLGQWLDFYENHQLAKEGIRTKGVVTAAWINNTRRGGKQKLFRVKFKTRADYREIFSHVNTLNYQVGDSVLVDYLPSEPNTYRIVY